MIIESHAHYSHKRYDGVFRYLTSDLKAQEGQREDLLDRLRKDGLDVPLDALTVDECAAAITAALAKN